MKNKDKAMDLIIKPTEACNFACSFCSSPKLSDSPKNRLPLEKIYEFLERFPNTNTIIVNGGDPTMVPVKYYWDLIDHMDKHGYTANICLTSNLWKFWKEWEKDVLADNTKLYSPPTQEEIDAKPWTKLFRHPRIDLTTSFQYGEGRKIRKDRVFTERDFIRIQELMLSKVGHRVSFISVIGYEDLDDCIKNVELAKELNVDCSLNYVVASGHAETTLPKSYIYEKYLEVHRRGLTNWESNTRQMIRRIVNANETLCPLNRRCDEGIRVLHPDGSYYSCGSFADDLDKEIDYEKEVKEGEFFTPLQDDKELHRLKDECLTCPMFDICNGCYKHIKDLKRTNQVEKHCTKMKSIANEILSASNLEAYKDLKDED